MTDMLRRTDHRVQPRMTACGCEADVSGLILHDLLCTAEQQPQPTAEDYCAADGHRYHSDDGDSGRCYCGRQIYACAEVFDG